MADLNRIEKLIALAYKNTNKEEAVRAIRLAIRAAKTEAACLVFLQDALVQAEVDRSEKRDQALEDALLRLRPESDWRARLEQFQGVDDAPTGGSAVGSRWVPRSVEKNPHGRGYRVRGMGPGFYSPLFGTREEAQAAAPSCGAFATAWAEPKDGSHLEPEAALPKDIIQRLFGR